MNEQLFQYLLEVTESSSATKTMDIQSLWSGYGAIARYQLEGRAGQTVVVKHVTLPNKASHPRGWNTNLSHQRKITSYQVECAWYQNYSDDCTENFRVPRCYGTISTENEFLMVLEDLDSSGYPLRIQEPSIEDMKPCLRWLANLHSHFLFDASKDASKQFEALWDVGCYWHLDTRPDEWEALSDEELKQAAPKIDLALKDCRYQTLVHGDAKLANFCFSKEHDQVAAVDFQYVGAGCGMKDVAYFIGSCLNAAECERYESDLLNCYFSYLKTALANSNSDMLFGDLETEWRSMYGIAVADFQRFLKGWNPNHWKINKYSERLTKQALNQILQR